jgi:hypothetical protein
VTDEQAREAAQYFASLPRRPFGKVVEAETVPVTALRNGRMRYVEPDAGTEPIGDRIITVPDDMARARLRDPYSGFTSRSPRARRSSRPGAAGPSPARFATVPS